MDLRATAGRASDANTTPLPSQQALEWLQTNRSGDYALGSVDRKLRRKYHSLLTVREPGRGEAWNILADVRERLSLVARDEHVVLADVRTGGDSPQREGDIVAQLVGFSATPCATHRYAALGLTVERTTRLSEGARDQVELHYRISGLNGPVELALEPLLLCRDAHALTFENPFLDGSFHRAGDELRMVPYAGMPAIAFRIDGIDRRAGAEGRFVHDGRWLTDLDYAWEEARGYPAHEHLFCPGRFVVRLPAHASEVELTFVVGLAPLHEPAGAPRTAPTRAQRLSLSDKLARAVRQFPMQLRDGSATVVAGYPWFGPRARDALIALPGVYLASGDFELVSAVLERALATRVDGLVPNFSSLGSRSPPVGATANATVKLGATEANAPIAPDVSLLFIRAVQWLAEHAGKDRVERFMPSVCQLLEALAESRDPRVRLDRGIGVWTERGPWALTWMDSEVDGRPVTPRAGYAIELDALAYNAARFASAWAEGRGGPEASSFVRAFRSRLRTAEADFVRRYWDDARGYLADGHDGHHAESALRPNQLFALGLPYRAVPPAIARASLEAVGQLLLVPAGLRSLSPHDPAYRGHYGGAQGARDLSYHQGTAWPWMVGIYADAVQATYGRAALEARLSAVFSFFARHIDDEGCSGQIAELFSGHAPHVAVGAPAQAFSAAELYRALLLLHGDPAQRARGSSAARTLQSV